MWGEVSLCLSRACLGKMFVFMHQWLKKTVVTHHPLSEGSRGSPPNRAGAISSTSSSPSTAVSQGTNSTAASHPPSLSLPTTADDDTGVAPAAADTFPIEIKHVVNPGQVSMQRYDFLVQCNVIRSRQLTAGCDCLLRKKTPPLSQRFLLMFVLSLSW